MRAIARARQISSPMNSSSWDQTYRGINSVYLGSFGQTFRQTRGFSSQKATTAEEPDQELLNSDEKLEAYSVKHRLVKEGHRKKVGIWLLITAGAVFGMIVLGGYTRLSKSGLSMTKWKPIQYVYPKNEKEWEDEFDHYKVHFIYERNFLSTFSPTKEWT